MFVTSVSTMVIGVCSTELLTSAPISPPATSVPSPVTCVCTSQGHMSLTGVSMTVLGVSSTGLVTFLPPVISQSQSWNSFEIVTINLFGKASI